MDEPIAQDGDDYRYQQKSNRSRLTVVHDQVYEEM